MQKRNKPITISLSQEEVDIITEAAYIKRMGRSAFIREIVLKHIENGKNAEKNYEVVKWDEG